MLINKITIFSFLTVAVLLTGTIAGPMGLIQSVDALKSSGNPVGETNSKKVCGDRLCSEIPKEVKSEAKKKEEVKTEKKESKQKKIGEKSTSEKARYDELSLPPRTIKTDTVTSTQDPGLGHENHQLAIILPPSEKVYRGMLTFTSSENVQLVALVGPLKEGEDKGQAIWSPDGKTKYALIFVPLNTKAGTWQFAGNAIAAHTMSDEPFTISYTTAYRERTLSDTVKSETITSTQDPGLGHENHQLAIILPPRDYAYFGTLGFSASENVQLVSLHGPLQPGQGTHGQAIWSPDGKTFYALSFVDKDQSMGTWQFTGNAVALHTMNDVPFTVSYAVATGQ